jgi:hypothetical protein
VKTGGKERNEIMKDKIKSRRTNKEYQVEKIGSVYLINHKTLEEALRGVNAEMDIKSATEHSVVTCKIGDIITIGECTPDTVFNDLDKSYPVTLAWLRAFDRASIKYLDFEQDVYSNKEISKSMLVGALDAKKNANESKKNIKNEATKKTKKEVSNEPIPVKNAEELVIAKSVEEPKTAAKPVEPEKIKVVVHDKNEKLLFSKWKNFPISEAMNEKGFIEFIRLAQEKGTEFPDNDAINDQFDYVKSLVG